jgi:hypothetical protein
MDHSPHAPPHGLRRFASRTIHHACSSTACFGTTAGIKLPRSDVPPERPLASPPSAGSYSVGSTEPGVGRQANPAGRPRVSPRCLLGNHSHLLVSRELLRSRGAYGRRATQITESEQIDDLSPCRIPAARPNPSLKLTRYGMQRKPVVRRLRHLRTPSLHCMPPRAA